MESKVNKVDLDCCLAEIHKKLYRKNKGPSRACSERAWILYYYLKYHNLDQEIVRYTRKDGMNIILHSGLEKYPSHVFVILDNFVLDSNLERKQDKEKYIDELYSLNDYQIKKRNPVPRSRSNLFQTVKDNLPELFVRAFK